MAQKLVELPFPVAGLSVHGAFSDQEKGTCVDCRNVRAYDPTTNRVRGAQRCGHSKYVSTQLNGANFIQNINQVSGGGIRTTAGFTTRTIKAIAVGGGTIKTFTRAGWSLPTNGTAALHATNPFVNSVVLNNKVYYADGANWKYYDPNFDTVYPWNATAGALPTDSQGSRPKLIMQWRGRICVSGLGYDPSNWFMCRQFNPGDWDYGAAITDATMAVAGNNAEAGKCPDIVNCLIAYNDDISIFGGDHSIWQMTEDPMSGGQFDRISDTVGMAFGTPFCRDAVGNLFFMGSRGSLYVCNPGQGGVTAAPQRISGTKVDARLLDIDFSAYVVKMVFDDRFQAIMFYITPIAGGATVNWCYDLRQGAFWPDSFGNNNHNVTTAFLFDADSPTDRVVLLGCYDGYVREIDIAAKDDDGTAISSYVWIGPIQANSQRLRLRELRGVLAAGCDPVQVDVFSGNTPEAAYGAVSRWTKNWNAGLSPANKPMTTGQAMFLKLSNSTVSKTWELESIYAEIEALGSAAGRAL
jgi:hypothetical protein